MTNLEGKIQKRWATPTAYARGLNTASNIPKMNWAGPIEFLLCLVSSNRYPCADHAHEYKKKRKQEKLPRFCALAMSAPIPCSSPGSWLSHWRAGQGSQDEGQT